MPKNTTSPKNVQIANALKAAGFRTSVHALQSISVDAYKMVCDEYRKGTGSRTIVNKLEKNFPEVLDEMESRGFGRVTKSGIIAYRKNWWIRSAALGDLVTNYPEAVAKEIEEFDPLYEMIEVVKERKESLQKGIVSEKRVGMPMKNVNDAFSQHLEYLKSIADTKMKMGLIKTVPTKIDISNDNDEDDDATLLERGKKAIAILESKGHIEGKHPTSEEE